jgi:ribonuclease PH
MRRSRKFNELRNLNTIIDFTPNSMGSVLFEMGNTRIIAAVTVDDKVPDHAKNRETGWLTAEYDLMPYSTPQHSPSNPLKKDGRSVEIQRLIGRSIRGIVDLKIIKGYMFTVYCHVIQADAGTRAASVTAAYIALKLAVKKMLKDNLIEENPIKTNIAAISLGYVKNEILLDLDYSEDKEADVDMNIVMDGDFNLIEIQGTGEKSVFSVDQLNEMINLSKKGLKELFSFQNKF